MTKILLGTFHRPPNSMQDVLTTIEDSCQHFSLHKLINEPTHHRESSSSITDFLFTSNINSIVLGGVGEPILDQNIRYRCPVYCVLNFDKITLFIPDMFDCMTGETICFFRVI